MLLDDKYFDDFFIGGGYYFPGKWLRNMSRVVLDNLSGNTISKLMIKSPRLPGSLGKGSPLLTMRLTVEGLTISSWRLTIILSPPKSGTSTLDPQRACKKRRKKNIKYIGNFFFVNQIHDIIIHYSICLFALCCVFLHFLPDMFLNKVHA